MASASQAFGNSRQTQPSTSLSAAVHGSRAALPRRSTRISVSSAARDRNRSTTRPNTSFRRPDIPAQRRPILHPMPTGFNLRQGQPALRSLASRQPLIPRNPPLEVVVLLAADEADVFQMREV